ncbi:MAG: O-antigen ligase family protein [Chloroflexota bacterium]
MPASLGIGLFATLYVADADDIWHQYRAVLLYPADALVALTGLAWLVALAASGRMSARASLAPLGIGALGIAAAVSAAAAMDQVVALAVAAHLAVLALFAIAAGDLILTGRGKAFWRFLSVTVIAQAALAAWQAVMQSTAPAGALFNGWAREFAVDDSVAVVAVLPGVERWLRAYGSFPHPNILGIFLAVALVVLSLRADPSRLTRIAQLAGVTALALTFSRSAWLAVSLATATWVVTTVPWRDIPAWIGRQLRSRAALAALVAVGLILSGARATQLDAFPEANSLSQRRIYDDAAWSLVAQGTPVGAGNILIAEQRQGFAVGEPAHNVFLITLAELGPLGVLAWFALAATLVAAAWRRTDPGGRGAALAAGTLLPLLVFDHYLWTQPPGRIWLVLALAVIPAAASWRRPLPHR